MKIISLSEEFQDIQRARFLSCNNENEQRKLEEDKIIEDELIISRSPTIVEKCERPKIVVKANLNIDKFHSHLEAPKSEMYGNISEKCQNLSLVSSGESTPHLYVDYKQRIEGLLLLNFSLDDKSSLCGSPST